MGKRTKVPAALHSELSEYSSLIRALRTNNALDLATQLTSSLPASVAGTQQDDDEDLAGDADSVNLAPEDASSSQPPPEPPTKEEIATRKAERKAERKALKTKLPRDTWTRWPLLADDVPVPEWTFEDEIALLAERSLENHLSSSSGPGAAVLKQSQDPSTSISVPDDSHGIDVEDDEPSDSLVTQYALDGLTASASQYLAQILALLAAHVPAGEKCMQNRVHPINWESVLDIAAVNGLVQPEALVALRERLSSIYPTSHPTVHIHRAPKTKKRRTDDLSFLIIEGHEPEPLPQKRKRGPYKKREASVPLSITNDETNRAMK